MFCAILIKLVSTKCQFLQNVKEIEEKMINKINMLS